MALFGKRVVVYRVQGDKPAWKAARQTLRAAGVKIVESGAYESEMPVCGCGAKIDRRNYGPNGWIDRLTYYIAVRPEDESRAAELLKRS